ncbi:hypothetical protein DFP72DRAFT_891334 [Ephemerocybe angulata]|uniref:Uncharacterized protein n=1 Tax=Ephemerocybe angulata TaxID=980116 RepID=A0A8H6I403_9AGAR|nr:hypothetical protein DFP72DRAFT_891334 [Tulosesus angulatus]
MNRPTSPYHCYSATDGGLIEDPEQREEMLKHLPAVKVLKLRVQDKVVLIMDVYDTLRKGTTGRVVRFADPGRSLALEGTGDALEDIPNGTTPCYPIVDFQVSKAVVRRSLVLPEVFSVLSPDGLGGVDASRTQIPLALIPEPIL